MYVFVMRFFINNNIIVIVCAIEDVCMFLEPVGNMAGEGPVSKHSVMDPFPLPGFSRPGFRTES